MPGKLVRDKIPEIIEVTGKKPKIRILSDEEYLLELDNKLIEEIEEYTESRTLEELADVLEVLMAHCNIFGYSEEELLCTRLRKRSERGGFEQKLFWSGNE